MNNLNIPFGNNEPEPRGGNQWNYALLVPMLGLAAFRWIWSRESQKEICDFKEQYSKEMLTEISEMEVRYRETLTAECKKMAKLELELEKERQRVEGYKKALLSQSQKLIEERKQLQQEREKEWQHRATASLKELEDLLMQRQDAYCSPFLPRTIRLEIEKKMLLKASRDPIEGVPDLEADLKNIFENDKHCAKKGNVDQKKNGNLMWVYLKYWQEQVSPQKHDAAK